MDKYWLVIWCNPCFYFTTTTFYPVKRNGEPLIDGGVLNPVPIVPIFGNNTDLIITVNLGGAVKNKTSIVIANQAFDAMQITIARQKLAAYPTYVVIGNSRNACGTLEFDRADEMIQLGYQSEQQCFEYAAR